MPADIERRRRVRERLAESRLDAIICRLPENVVLLSGCYPIIGQTAVVFPAEGEPTLVLPAQEEYLADGLGIEDVRSYDCWRLGDPSPDESLRRLLGQVCADRGLIGRRVGYEDTYPSFAPPQMSAEPPELTTEWEALLRGAVGAGVVSATGPLDELRARKTPTEIDRLRRANRVACMGLDAFKAEVRAGRTEAEVGAAIERAVLAIGTGFEGARSARGWAQVMSGPRTETAWYYPVSTDRRIAEGDLVLVELGVVVDGYWSDLTRTVVAGRASDRQREVYDAVKRAQAADLAACRPGARGDEVDAVGRRILDAAGLGRYFLHHTGHGIGFRYHEPYPWLHPDSRQTLAEGNVHSIEPGVYIPGFGGVRLEDDAVVLEDRAEFLSLTDFGLD
jgi:Xaa-Pro aminopeptidase